MPLVRALVGVGGAAAAPAIANQIVHIGAKTANSSGGPKAINSNGAEVAFASIVSQAGATRTWSVSATGRLVANGTPDVDDGKPLTCTVTTGEQIVVTLKASGTDVNGNDLALARSVAPSTSEAELKAAMQHASLARGEFILLRPGTYNSAQADVRCTRTGAVGGSSGYVTITPHAEATVSNPAIIKRLSVYGTTIQANYFYFKGLGFLGTNDGTYSGSAGGLLAFVNSVTDIKISACTFDFPATSEAVASASTLTNGLSISGASTARFDITGNTFTNCYGAINAIGVDISIINNDVDTFFNDVFKISPPVNNLKINSNRIANAKTPYTPYVITGITKGATTAVTVSDSTGIVAAQDMFFVNVGGMTEINSGISYNISAIVGNVVTVAVNSLGFSNYTSGGEGRVIGIHGDFVQLSLAGATTGQMDDVEAIGNVLERGTATTGFKPDKQMFFFADNDGTGDIRRAKVNGNMIIGYGGKGIDLTNPVDCQVKNNTAVAQIGGIADMAIALRGGSGNTVVNNILNGAVTEAGGSANNVIENNTDLLRDDTAAYTATFVNPLVPVPAVTNFAVLSGVRGAAGSGRVNFVAHTVSIPPWLAAATGVDAGGGAVDISVHSDTKNGTLYWVVTASATGPTKAQVKSGQDAAGAAALAADSVAVSTVGTQTDAAAGVTAGTRYVHFMHEDTGALQSEVETSASFSVAASGSLAAQFLLMEAA